MSSTNGRGLAADRDGKASGVSVTAASVTPPELKFPADNCKCQRCRRAFKRDRVEQKYCSARCRNASVKARLRARSGDLKPRRRHLVVTHREAVTFGQKKPTKSKRNVDLLTVDFRRPVIDFWGRRDFDR